MESQIFDAVACYFPITFVPPPDDPYGVSPLALISLLQESMCHHPMLLRRLLPFLLDKMHSEGLVRFLRYNPMVSTV